MTQILHTKALEVSGMREGNNNNVRSSATVSYLNNEILKKYPKIRILLQIQIHLVVSSIICYQ